MKTFNNPMRFFFLRHGETLWNLEKRCQGQTDIALSTAGQLEAENFAKKSAHLTIHHIFSSPLKRALSTAQILKKYHQTVGLTILEEFQERNYGSLEGGSSQDMYTYEEKERSNPHQILDPSIETLPAIRLRLEKGLKIAFARNDEPFIVSHGRLFLSLCDYLEVPQIPQIKNLSLYEFQKNAKKWEIRQILFD